MVPHYAVSAVVYAETTATFEAVDASGVVRVTVTLPAGQTREVPLGVPSGTVLQATGAIAWTVRVVDLPGFISGVEPQDIGPVDTVSTAAPGFYVP